MRADSLRFYAPWCGHCQNLKPAYEKVAKALDGLANVAAVNCDDEENKAFCGKMGIQGFPTLKTVRQTGMYGKPIMMDYKGGRSASDMVEAVKNLIPNVVDKLENKNLDTYLSDNRDLPRAILFTDKGTTAALTKVLANEYVTNLKFAQARKKEDKVTGKFGVDKFPTLLVLPAGSEEPVVYEGAMEKQPLNEFLDQYAERYDAKAAAKAAKSASKKDKSDKKTSSADASKFEKASASHAAAEASEAAGSASTITLDMPDFTELPDPEVDGAKPVSVPDVTPPIPVLATEEELVKACLGPKTGTCVVALLPPEGGETAAEQPEPARKALRSLADLAQKHKQRGGSLFPFYALPSDNPGNLALKSALEIGDGDVQLVAINGTRSWWNKFSTEKGFEETVVENWIDGIRFGEAKKHSLPEGMVPNESAKEQEKPVEHEEL